MNNLKKNTGAILVIIAGIAWGMISIFVRKFNSANFDTWDIMFYRSWVSVLLLFVYFLVTDRRLLKISIKDIWMFLGTGIFSLTFFTYCYFNSIVELGTSVAVVLLYTSPIFVLIMSVFFFHEKMNRYKLLAVIMTFAGCIFVTGILGGDSTNTITFKGLLMGLGAGFGYALYSIFAGFAMKKYSSLTIVFYTFLLSGISVLLIRNPFVLVNQTGADMIPYIVGISLICTVLPYITYTSGMKKMDIGKAAVLVTVEPVVGALIGVFAWGESAGIIKIIGIILILAAVIILSEPSKEEG